MMLFIIILGIIVLMNTGFRLDNKDILSKEDTKTINAIFVLCIFFSHSVQYLNLDGNFFNSLYRHFQNFHNQWVVVSFLMFSGFGVVSQIKTRGVSYITDFPRNRILKTLINFDIAVFFYMIIDKLLYNSSHSIFFILASLIGITSFGNSNWYIFAILVMYLLSYISAILAPDKLKCQAIICSIGTLIYIITLSIVGAPSRFYSTIFCYPLGVWLFLYKNNIISLFRSKKTVSLAIILLLLGITYKFRFNDYVMNFASCVFGVGIIWFLTFFKVKSRFLTFIGNHVFSIFILQRIPMILISNSGLFAVNPYLFVSTSLILTIIISVIFDKGLGVLNNLFLNSRD